MLLGCKGSAAWVAELMVEPGAYSVRFVLSHPDCSVPREVGGRTRAECSFTRNPDEMNQVRASESGSAFTP